MSSITQKIVTISSKRQITIPQRFFDSLGFSTQAQCVAKDGGLFITPIKENQEDDDFSTEILSDLIDEGFTGRELLREFKIRKAKIRPAVERMIQEADKALYDDSTKEDFGTLFAAEPEVKYGK